MDGSTTNEGSSGGRRGGTRRRVLVAVGIGSAVVALAGVVAVAGGPRAVPTPGVQALATARPSVAIAPASTPAALPSVSGLPTASTARPAGTPKDGWIAYSNAALGAHGDLPTLGLVDAAGRRLRVGTGSDKPVACPAFSPDGHELAYRDEGGLTVQPIETAGAVGAARWISIPGRECQVWSPAGDRFAVVLPSGELAIFDRQGTETSLGRPCPGAGAQLNVDLPIAWSPTGDLIALTCSNGVWVAPVDGGAPRQIASVFSSSVSWSPDGTRLAFDQFIQRDPANGLPNLYKVWAAPIDDPAATVRLGPGTMPIWSPDGDFIAYQGNDRVVVIGAGGRGSRTVGVKNAYGFGGWSPDGRQVLQMVDVNEAWDLIATDVGTDVHRTILHAVPTGSARSFGGALELSWQPVWTDR
jgi:WD40 repeat protein